MSIAGGYVLLARQLDSSDIIHEPPVVRELWLYVLRKVAHKSQTKYDVNCSRGEGFFRLDDIQEDLCWFVGYRKMKYSKPQLTKSLRRLRERNMIATTKATRGVFVKVLNYDYFQDPGNYEGNGEGNAKETRRQQSRITKNKNVKNVRMEEEEKTCSASDDAARAGGNGSETFFLTRRKRKLKGKRLETFNRFWEVFAYKRGKAEAADAWLDIPTLTESIVEDICAAAKAESSTRQQVIAEGRTPKMAQGWITGRRWEDEDLKPQTPEDHLKIKYAAFLAEDDGGIKQ